MEKHLFDGNIGQVLSLSEIKKEKSRKLIFLKLYNRFAFR
jgi:hypothetical protein